MKGELIVHAFWKKAKQQWLYVCARLLNGVPLFLDDCFMICLIFAPWY